MAAIAGADDVENVHRSRVQIKRIRYLVEPLRTQTPEARAFAKQLKDLQRLLGELHDVHLLESQLASAVEDAATEKARRVHRLAVEGDDKMLARVRRRDESLGLVALAASARESRDALYLGLRRAWLAKQTLVLQAGFEGLRDSITPAAKERTATGGIRVASRATAIAMNALIHAATPKASAKARRDISRSSKPRASGSSPAAVTAAPIVVRAVSSASAGIPSAMAPLNPPR